MIRKITLFVLIFSFAFTGIFAQPKKSAESEDVLAAFLGEYILPNDAKLKGILKLNFESLSFLTGLNLGNTVSQDAISGVFRDGALNVQALLSEEQRKQLAHIQQQLAARLLTNSMVTSLNLDEVQKANLYSLNFWAAEHAVQLGQLAVDRDALTRQLIGSFSHYESRLKNILNIEQWNQYQEQKIETGAKIATEFMRIKLKLSNNQYGKVLDLNKNAAKTLVELQDVKNKKRKYQMSILKLNNSYNKQMKKILDKNQYKKYKEAKDELQQNLVSN